MSNPLSRKNSKSIFLILILLIALVPVIPVQGAWLEGWDYRKSHTITGSSAGQQTDYQVGIKVYDGAGTDGTESITGTVLVAGLVVFSVIDAALSD